MFEQLLTQMYYYEDILKILKIHLEKELQSDIT